MNMQNTKKSYFTTEKAGGRWGVVVSFIILCFATLLLFAAWMYLWTNNALGLSALPAFETDSVELAEVQYSVEQLEASQKMREML